ncbi:hypothetical protein V1264_003726 [Littorina saxatilis]|uniref:Uncharacterized protein n=2 Tax=Littorina saxatilis TaxID=31220 RepID=A0AAN9B071_9CAEN
MIVSRSNVRDGVASMEPSQVEAVPGSMPQRSPPPATGSSHPSEIAREGRSNATGNFTLMHWNAEGVRNKKQDLQQFLKTHSIDICCVQETHLNENHRFTMRGYESFRLDRAGGPKGGVLTLVKNTIPAAEVYRSNDDSSELLGIKVFTEDKAMTFFNLYSPPTKPLHLQHLQPASEHWLIAGDFNSHSPSWGYAELDRKGEDLEDWMFENNLILLNRPDDPPTYYSRSWRTTSTPDLAIATDDIASIAQREVNQQLGGSDHKPVIIQLQEQVRTTRQKLKPSWNYKKARWNDFERKLDENCRKLDLQDENLNDQAEHFTAAVLKAAKKTIPRGRRRDYKPGWNDHLQQLHDAVCTAREAMEENPTDELVTAHNKAKAEFTKVKLQQLRNSWHEKTQSLSMDKDTFKLWQLTKTLNNDRPEKRQTVLEANGEFQTGKIAANTLARMYQQDSTVTLPRERTRAVREQLQQTLIHDKANSCMSSALRMDELEEAIRALKCKKAPGPDGISNDMIKHFGNNAKHALLKLFNHSWRSGAVPSSWKRAHVIPILKKGKDRKSPASYRPISLLSCLGKLMERILNRRLIWHLESNNILAATQTGYRGQRNTEDQLTLLAQDIEDAFQQKHKVVGVFFDLSKAFDRVWREALLLKVRQSGVTGRMYTWVKSFLHERSARVVLDGYHSVSVKMREGVPQGGVISPTLFLIYINDITSAIPRHVSNTLHADDLAIWSSAEHTTSAAHRIQDGVKRIHQWTEDWGLQLNRVKSVATVFSLSTSKEKVNLKLGESALPQVETPTFLGVKLDSRLTWKPHLEEIEARGIRRLAIMRKLSGTTWGANSQILKTVYTGAVRPVLEYASSSWNTAARTNKARLDRVQNLGLRTVLGAMKTTPISEMQKVANIEPLEDRRQAKLLIQGEKHKRLESHPLHNKFQALTKNRLKRQSPNHQLKAQQRENADILQPSPDQCERLNPKPWSPQSQRFHVRMSIPGISGKQQQSDAALRSLALEEIHRRYPASKWTHAYTDGSAECATKNGGSGVFIQIPGRPPETLTTPCGVLCSNFKAEVVALHTAADFLTSLEETPPKVVFLSDCLSALQVLTAPAEHLVEELKKSLNDLSQKASVVLQWIPAHCGIAGNEKADGLAKDAGRQEQPETSLSFRETKTLIKHRWKTAFKERNGGYKPDQDPIHRLSRAEQTAIFRLRTGHCGFKAHLKRIGVAESALCDCGAADQTVEHVLNTCTNFTLLRNQIWPEGATLETKLWGTSEDLKATFQFTTAAELRP